MTGYVNLEEVETYFTREEWRTPDEKWWPEREIGLLLALLSKGNVKEVRSGTWTFTTHGLMCSACKTYQPTGSRYFKWCPICGAEMKMEVEYEQIH